MKKNRRTTIFHVRKNQRIFFYPVIVAFFLGCIVSWLSLTYFLVGEYLAQPDVDQIQKVIPGLLAISAVLMFSVIFWTFRILNRYFGSYNRIINDLDEVLSGKRNELLTARKDDVIFEALLHRVNAIIQKHNQSQSSQKMS